jgi:3-oxoacyl-[acyl-carrier-protein] synthase II
MIRHGYLDFAIVGGAESVINELAIVAFGNIKATSSWKGRPEQSSRPFDRERSGFVLSEGAAALILESEESLVRSGVLPYASVEGFGISSDAYHFIAMDPSGAGAERAIIRAMRDAGISANDVDYLNTHGTSTKMNDRIEADLIRRIFAKKNPVVNATKSVTGHMLGAAGAYEVAVTAVTLSKGIVPPTKNLNSVDIGCELNHVVGKPLRKNLRYAISNSFGFGGTNVAIVLQKGTR